EVHGAVAAVNPLRDLGAVAGVARDHQPAVAPGDRQPRRVVLEAVGGADLDEIFIARPQLAAQDVDDAVFAVLTEAAELPAGGNREIDLAERAGGRGASQREREPRMSPRAEHE